MCDMTHTGQHHQSHQTSEEGVGEPEHHGGCWWSNPGIGNLVDMDTRGHTCSSPVEEEEKWAWWWWRRRKMRNTSQDDAATAQRRLMMCDRHRSDELEKMFM